MSPPVRDPHAPDTIRLDRESFFLLVAAARGVLPTLIANRSPRAWALSEAITAAERAVLEAR